MGHLLKSLKKLKVHDETPPVFSPSMSIGIAGHMYCLEPEVFNDCYEIYPDDIDKRTKIYKSMKLSADEKGVKLLSESELSKLKGCKEALKSHPAGKLLDQSEKEVVAIWNHDATGIECKAKIDMLGEDFIADLKFTGKEIDPRNDYQLFQMIYERGYYRQMAFYSDAFPEIKHQYVIFIELEPPHEITWIDLSEDPNWMELGRREIDVAMHRYLDFLKWINGSPVKSTSYSRELRHVTCPDWALSRVTKLEDEVYEF